MRAFFTALGFLTIAPVPRAMMGSNYSMSMAYFPVVGLAIGAALWGIDKGMEGRLPDAVIAALLVAALMIMTRGLHTEGFMDTCDGLLGGHTRERRLEIMRDPHVGAFAVMGVVVLLLVKWSVLMSLDGPSRGWTLLLFPAMGKWAMVMSVTAFPYARSEGLGRAFQEGPKATPLVIAGISILAAALLLGGVGGMILLSLATGVSVLLGRVMASMLGGLTGDTYGAINESSEAAVLVMVAGLASTELSQPFF
ncbi:MAG: adenosylcobinamide-GDP ribazoletransferase [SAR202 cluster bacterium]|nr:adenosylcobinamide-GDP ribazoletransferase [SAR202 cluster bacterium]